MRIILPGIWSRGRWIDCGCCIAWCLVLLASARQTVGEPAAEGLVAAAEEQASRLRIELSQTGRPAQSSPAGLATVPRKTTQTAG